MNRRRTPPWWTWWQAWLLGATLVTLVLTLSRPQ